MSDPTKRFNGLAEIYAKARPSYPEAAIQRIVELAKLTPHSVLVDVGCGTGISTRLLAHHGFRVIGIEPNADMLRQAESEPAAAGSGNVEYRHATAEDTGLADNIADLVLAAQAFHWFRPDPALMEFQRILAPNCWVALMWNERDESDAFTKAFGDALRPSPETTGVEGHRAQAGDALLTSKKFTDARKECFPNGQRLDEDGVIRRAFSASYAPKDKEGTEKLRRQLQKIFAQHNKDGAVDLLYETSIYLARKA
jgi:SAM-dependent methyltransferase